MHVVVPRQDLLAAGSPPPVDAAAAAANAAAPAAPAAAPLPADAEAALGQLSEALQRELKAVVGPDVDVEAAAGEKGGSGGNVPL